MSSTLVRSQSAAGRFIAGRISQHVAPIEDHSLSAARCRSSRATRSRSGLRIGRPAALEGRDAALQVAESWLGKSGQ